MLLHILEICSSSYSVFIGVLIWVFIDFSVLFSLWEFPSYLFFAQRHAWQ
jgi:hypothetical protein